MCLFKLFTPKDKYTKQNALDAIELNPMVLQRVGKYRDDKEVVEKAVIKNSSAFIFASDKLKKDKEFITYLIVQKDMHQIIKHAPDKIRSDEKYITELALQNDNVLMYVSNEIRKKVSKKIPYNSIFTSVSSSLERSLTDENIKKIKESKEIQEDILKENYPRESRI